MAWLREFGQEFADLFDPGTCAHIAAVLLSSAIVLVMVYGILTLIFK